MQQTNSTPNCPKCGSRMVLRTNSRNGSKFYGCPKYPNCNVTRNYTTEVVSQPQSHQPVMSKQELALGEYVLNGKPFTPSHRQADVLKFVLNPQAGNLFLNAYAGTGKSTTCAFVINQLPRSLQVVYFAFNKAIADEFRSKYGLNAMTMHSFGYQIICQAMGKVDGSKKAKLAQKYYPVHKSLRKFVAKVASLAVNTLTDYKDLDALEDMVDHYGIEMDESILNAKDDRGDVIPLEHIFKVVQAVILDSLELVETEKVIDYDEMLYYPVIANIIPRKFDFIFVDEAQGTIRTIAEEAAKNEWRQLDNALIMCRTNAPLVKACLGIIKTGKRAAIAGRNIAEGLLDLIEQMNASNVDDLMAKLEAYRDREVGRLMERDLEDQAELLSDKVECVLAFCDGQVEVWSVASKIEAIFTDDRNGKVLFSSVHRAKGMESRDCYIIEPKQLPFKASKPWQAEQERNLAYVAFTRSLSNMTFVGGSPNFAKLAEK